MSRRVGNVSVDWLAHWRCWRYWWLERGPVRTILRAGPLRLSVAHRPAPEYRP